MRLRLALELRTSATSVNTPAQLAKLCGIRGARVQVRRLSAPQPYADESFRLVERKWPQHHPITTLKIAVARPTPSATIAIAVTANMGDLASSRAPNRRSFSVWRIPTPGRSSRRGFVRVVDAAEFQAGDPIRCVWRHAARDVRLRLALEMEPHFLGEIRVDTHIATSARHSAAS